MTINRFELAPAAKNPPYPGGPYVGCCAAVAQDFIENYTAERIGDLGALFASMTQRHRNMDPACVHGIRDHGACAFCAYLELDARGLPVAYQALPWSGIETLMAKGQYVGISGMYGQFPYVSVSSYSATIPATGRSDTFTGSHIVAGIAARGADRVVLDPDFGNWRGTPPYSLISAGTLQSFWATLRYPVVFATKAPGGAAPSHKATVRTPNTHLYNPVTKVWVYSLKVGTVLTVGGHATMQGGKSCVPVRGPDPYNGYFVPVANVRILP